MKPSPESLREHYADLNDRALLDVAAERDTLTPEAHAVLQEQLQQRGLLAPDLAPAVDATETAVPWVTIDRFRDLSSAIVARGALEAAGIPCFLRDENTVRLDWQISNFIGGMRLQVHADDEAAARSVLLAAPTEQDASEAQPLEPEEHCPFCGSSDLHRVDSSVGVRAAALWLFALPLPLSTRSWHCDHCGREFPEEEIVLRP